MPEKKSQESKEGKKKEREVDIEEYQDPSGVTIKKLERAFWFFQHRKDFKTALIALLIIFSVLTWGYVLWGYGKYLAVGMKQDNQNMTKLAGPLLINQAKMLSVSPEKLDLGGLKIIRSNNKFDLAIKITNPNPHHYARFKYCFHSGEEKLDCGENFILPQESKYILSLSQEVKKPGASLSFNTQNVNWGKINRHKISSWSEFKKEKMNFTIQNIKLTPGNKSKLSEGLNLSNLDFEVSNNSGFSYYEVPFNILLIKQSKIVALNRYTIYNFHSGDKKNIEITWPNLGFTSGEIKITPRINILDQSIYMNPEKPSVLEDIRDLPLQSN